MSANVTEIGSLSASVAPARKPRSSWDRARHNRNLMIGVSLLGLLILIALLAPVIAPYGLHEQVGPVPHRAVDESTL